MKKTTPQSSIYKIAWLILGLGMTIIIITLLVYWASQQEKIKSAPEEMTPIETETQVEFSHENEIDPEIINGLIEDYYQKNPPLQDDQINGCHPMKTPGLC